MKQYSFLMRFFLMFGMVKFAWACRRLYCPVPKDALVLEVGSGGSPYFRANVLVDAYESTRERHWVPFVKDRPSVVGLGENLPFKDKVFDFVIASHVLEHSSDPESFLKELQRVAKAGYIETPSAFMERINPYWDHRSEVDINNGLLEIKKKSSWKVDNELVQLYERYAKEVIAKDTIPSNPFNFHTRFYWEGNVPYRIINPEIDSTWKPPIFTETTSASNSFRGRVGRLGLYWARQVLSQKKRNKNIKLEEIMRCSLCKSGSIFFVKGYATCSACDKKYNLSFGTPNML